MMNDSYDDGGEYARALHEAGKCDWHCSYCIEENPEDLLPELKANGQRTNEGRKNELIEWAVVEIERLRLVCPTETDTP